MMNSIGLQNIGVEAFVRDKVPALRQVATPYIVNVFGYEPDDYLEIAPHPRRYRRPLSLRILNVLLSEHEAWRQALLQRSRPY